LLLNLFILDDVYKRSLIHDQYGGNRQGGISASAKFPYIFIFSGKAGHQHGYKDQWENPNIFSYTGEGQVNDMRFIKGNLALRDHLANGKRVFLFTEDIRSFVKFQGELALDSVDFFTGPDRDGKDRVAIKFFFKKVGAVVDYPVEHTIPLVEDNIINMPNITERRGLVTSRVGQGAYRKSILYRWEFKCAVTEYSKNEILIASHILPWKDANNDERLDVDNGILLSPNYDALFDQHLISFENTGKIILSDALLKTNYDVLGVTGKEKIKNFHSGNHLYLEGHRKLIV
jgi:5-methylcytosine-specific restriction enzyme A